MNPAYRLSLADDWVEVETTDPEQRHFESQAKDAGLVVSSLPSDIADTERLAHKFAEFRLDAESAGAEQFDYRVTIAEPRIETRPWGHAIAYYGSDSNGRQFAFSGAITPKQILSLYISSRTLGEKELAAVFQDVLARLQFEEMEG